MEFSGHEMEQIWDFLELTSKPKKEMNGRHNEALSATQLFICLL